jgi:hypothetical protein
MPQLRQCSQCSRPATASIVRRVGPLRVDQYSAREAEKDPSQCEVVRLCAECLARVGLRP